MASTNVDTLLNPQSSSTKTNVAPKLRSTYFSRRTNNYNSSGSFNNVFDKVSSAPQQSSAPRDPSYRSSTVESTNRTSYNANRSAQQPSQPSTQQSVQKSEPKTSAPDDVKQSDPIEPIDQPEPVDVDQPDEVDEAPSQSTPQVPLEMSALFSTSTESLLAVREAPSNDEPVLMTVMPQQSNGNNQSMLNMLTGNNWLQPSSSDQPPVVEPEQLIPAVEELLAQLSDELGPIQTDVVEPELQPQSIEPIVESNVATLNQQPVDADQAQTLTRLGQVIEQPTSEQPLNELPIATDEPIDAPIRRNDQQPLQAATPSAGNATMIEELKPVEAQPIVEHADAAAQTQVISNDANLSNVVDAAKNSQPKVATSDIQAPIEQSVAVDADAEVPAQPTQPLSTAPIVERRSSAQVEQPITPTAQVEQPTVVEPQQPVQTQQTIQSQQPIVVEQPAQEILVEGINQPIEPQPDQVPRTPLANVEQPTQLTVEPTTQITQPIIEQSAQPNVEQPTQITQPIIEQSAQPSVEQPENLSAPTQTQQAFDENNAAPAPRGIEIINQPTAQPSQQATQQSAQSAQQPSVIDDAQPVAVNAENVEPVHQRFHGHANQQAMNEQAQQSSWTDRPAPLYQLAMQQRQASASSQTLVEQPTVEQPTVEQPSIINNTSAQGTPSATPTNVPNTQPLSMPTENISSSGQPTAARVALASNENILSSEQPTVQPTNTQPLNTPTENISSNAAPSTATLNTSNAQPLSPSINNTSLNGQPNVQTSTAVPNAQPSVENISSNAATASTSLNVPNTRPSSAPIENISSNAASASTSLNVPNAQPLSAPIDNTSTNGQPNVQTPTAVPNAQLSSAPIDSTSTNSQPNVQTPTAVPNTQPLSVPIDSTSLNGQPNVQTSTAVPNAQPLSTPIENTSTNDQPNVQTPTAVPNTQPLSSSTDDITSNGAPSAPNATAASQAQSTVVRNEQNVNRPVANMPQSFSVFGNELEINSPVTAPQQSAQSDQQPNQQQSYQQPNQQPNQQSNQQQLNQQAQQTAINVQAQAQAQAQQAPLAAAEGQPAMAQMPSESFAQNLGTAVNNLNANQSANAQQPSTQNTTFAQQLRDDFNVANQIVENARMIRTAQNTEMIIRLKPEHLGELTLRVSVTAEGTVNASFHSENAAVRAIIENSLVSLKQELANQGLKVDNVEVYSGLSDGSSLMNGKGRQGWQQNNQRNAQRVGRVRGSRSSEGGGAQSTATAQAVETAQPVENISSDGGVDYKV